jgi:hypothetical protein
VIPRVGDPPSPLLTTLASLETAPVRLGISIDVAQDPLNELVDKTATYVNYDNPEDIDAKGKKPFYNLHMPGGQRGVDPMFVRI